MCGVPPGGGLLVRPDGHVAWRQGDVGVPPRNLIADLVRPSFNNEANRRN
ncbi:hypothetical protein ACFFMR_04500 [Micromonospora andamanensis]